MNSASEGDKALTDSDPLGAIRHFTAALIELPRAPAYYIKRSTAYSRVKAADGGPNPSAALRDAEIALTLAQERGKRELILSAQMRRGVALYQLERFGDAGFVFEKMKEKTGAGMEGKRKNNEVKDAMAGGSVASGAKRNGYEQELPIWEAKVKGRLNKLGEGDEKGVVSVAEYPTGVKVSTEKDLKEQLQALKSGNTETKTEGQSQSSAGEQKSQATETEKAFSQEKIGTSAAPAATPAAPVPEKVRHEWYQSHDSVVVTLYIKGIAKDSINVELKDDSVRYFPSPPLCANTDFTSAVSPIPPPLRRRLRLHPRPPIRNHRPLHLQGISHEHQDRSLPAQANPRSEMECPRSLPDRRQTCGSTSCDGLKASHRLGPGLPYFISPWLQRLG